MIDDLPRKWPNISWAKEDALVVDAMRGSMWEVKCRDTLTQFTAACSELQFNSAIWSAKRRLARNGNTVVYWPANSFPSLGPIGLGTYGWKYDPAIIQAAVQAGIRLIDTAETYGYGRSETTLGKAVDLLEIVIATKVSRSHMSYEPVVNAAKRSVQKLGVQPIDLYQVHWPDDNKIEDTMRAMGKLLADGIIASVGVCNFSIDQVMRAQSLMPQGHRIRSLQVRYNLADRGIERALLPYCQAHDITLIAYSPLGHKFSELRAKDTKHALESVAKSCEVSEAQVALAWLMSHDKVVPIPRTNKIEHVREIGYAPSIHLTMGQIEALEKSFPVLE